MLLGEWAVEYSVEGRRRVLYDRKKFSILSSHTHPIPPRFLSPVKLVVGPFQHHSG